jgi:hypothetical protein
MQPSVRGTREGIVIAIAMLGAFVFFLFGFVLSYQTALDSRVMSPAVSPFVKYNVYFVVSLSALGVAVGATVFYFMGRRVDSSHTVAKKSAEIVLRFLSHDEQMVLKALLAKKGELLQSELSRTHGLSKVKAHRVVTRLVAKGIVTLTEHGKTKRLTLQPDIYEALKE